MHLVRQHMELAGTVRRSGRGQGASEANHHCISMGLSM